VTRTEYEERIVGRIAKAYDLNELGYLDDAALIASRVKGGLAAANPEFAVIARLGCDRLLQGVGQPVSAMDADSMERAARSITERCIAVKNRPAAIASALSVATVLRDRAYVEPGRFDGCIKQARNCVREVRDAIRSAHSDPQCDRELLWRIEHHAIFLDACLAADLGGRVSEREIARLLELDGDLKHPRVRLDTLRVLAAHWTVWSMDPMCFAKGNVLDKAAEAITDALCRYGQLAKPSPYTALSLFRWMCRWWEATGGSFVGGGFKEMFGRLFSACPQIGIYHRFQCSVPSVLADAPRRIACVADPARFGTRYSGICNLKNLLPL